MLSLSIFGQQGVAYDLKKPAKFENRTLASEKSGDNPKKIKTVRRFIQNTVTHYNFYFNANEKLNMVVMRAKGQQKDDYTTLLPFYDYSLENTASQKRELDSVIYKCTMGILIHDTRSDWVDNLYMLIGKSYYYKKDFDSAYITFQFLQFSFAPKEEDGYDKPIASNANADQGGNANIVSTVEKRNIVQKTFSLPPNRNESLLWKIRTYLAMDQFPEATSLIEVLKHDPQFPARLHAGLAEMQALSFYKQNSYDSAAFYLEKALPVAANNEETARWEYLIAQLYERTGRSYEAKTFYERTIRHTYNPVLEIYARLNAIRQNKEGGEDFIQKNIDALAKMAHKDKYESYRDIIYYTAAQMELERKNRAGAITFLKQCIKAAAEMGGTQRNRAFLLLANLSFEDRKYRDAKNYYDSLNNNDRQNLGDISWLPDRKASLAIIVTQLQIIDRQDSLLRIAAMPADQRDAFIKRLVRTLRKRSGLRDEGDSLSTNNGPQNNAAISDLFSNSSGNAEWYFNNASLRSKGYNDFKTRWGNRQNVDNWQLSSLAKNQVPKPGERGASGMLTDIDAKNAAAANAPVTFKSLMDNLPLTPEKLRKLNDSVERATYMLGKAYQDGLADYTSAITTNEGLLQKFPRSFFRAEVLFNLYNCYKKVGDEANAARILALLQKDYPNSRATALASNPDSTIQADGAQKLMATRQYERIYNSFIEGRFAEAQADKKIADSIYGDKYWTPQLLYIEAVYHIRQREDGQALSILSKIPAKYPKTPMAAKATTLIDVLKRRREIEDYLTKLEVKRASDEDTVAATVLMPGKVTAPSAPRLVRDDSRLLIKEDTSTLARSNLHVSGAVQTGKPGAPTIAGTEQLKVDAASLNKATMDAALLAKLQKQMDSLNQAMAKAAQDSIQTAILRHKSDSIQAAVALLRADSAAVAAKVKNSNSTFTYTPDKTHSVIIVLDKVDPVYVTETRNAFNRWNLENFYGQSLTIDNSALNDSLKLVVINSFENSAAALAYFQKAKAAAPREVVPWLPAGKYSFLIISAANLQLLLSNKDMSGYKKFLVTAYPQLTN
jgi:tetratricopeptide (TPR) repeat protein